MNNAAKTRIESIPAAAVEGFGKNAHLVHAAEIDSANDLVRVLCSRIKVEHLLDDATQYGAHPITCPTCKKRAAAR